MTNATTTPERIALLKAAGFGVENMTEAWGSGWWDGKFRFTHGRYGDGGAEPQDSEEKAWADADQFLARLEHPHDFESLSNMTLRKLRAVHDLAGGPRSLYEHTHCITPPTTRAVENNAAAFYSAFNARWPGTY